MICIMLAAQGIYAYKGIRPRTWLEKKSAKGAVRTNIIVLALLLAAAAAIIILSQTSVLPELQLDQSPEAQEQD